MFKPTPQSKLDIPISNKQFSAAHKTLEQKNLQIAQTFFVKINNEVLHVFCQ